MDDKLLFEQKILDELGAIYDLGCEFYNMDIGFSMLELTKKDIHINSFKAGISSGLFTIFAEEFLDADLGFGGQFLTIFGGTILGSFLFNCVSAREIQKKKLEKIGSLMASIELKKARLLPLIEIYVNKFFVNKSDFDCKTEFYDIFNNNLEYIMSGKEEEKFDLSFDYDNVFSILNYFMIDDDINSFLWSGNVRKRKS